MHASRYITRLAAVSAVMSVLASCTWEPGLLAGTPAQAGASDSAAGAVPTPTFVPVQGLQPPRFESISPPASASEGNAAPSTAAAPPTPAEPAASVPPATGEPVVAPPATDEPVSPPTEVSVVAGAESIRLDDEAWIGGWKQSKTYGGRSATWIYGTGTDYSAMEASFTLAAQPAGSALLSIEGMDGEHAPKMQISILVNGILLWTGPNPLPDDDFDLASGTWDSFGWTIPAWLLQPGSNTITIVALSEGSFGQPPFMMLDYADLSLSG